MVKLNSNALILHFNLKLPTKTHYYYYYAIMLRLVAPYINRLTQCVINESSSLEKKDSKCPSFCLRQ